MLCLVHPMAPQGATRDCGGENEESLAVITIPADSPFGGFATTFAPVGSVSLDSQSPKGSLRIQFPCHPASGGTIIEATL